MLLLPSLLTMKQPTRFKEKSPFSHLFCSPVSGLVDVVSPLEAINLTIMKLNRSLNLLRLRLQACLHVMVVRHAATGISGSV